MDTYSFRMFALAGALLLAAAGCSTTPEQKPAAAPEAKPAASPAPPPPPAAAPSPPPPAPTPAPMPEPLPEHRSVYFDFDKSLIHDSDFPVIEVNVNYLTHHAARQIRVEGNCDERGSREYNLALGQRRADAVRKRMKLLGVSEARIETISYGKERPKKPGHNEAAWAENRRSDIVYK